MEELHTKTICTYIYVFLNEISFDYEKLYKSIIYKQYYYI